MILGEGDRLRKPRYRRFGPALLSERSLLLWLDHWMG